MTARDDFLAEYADAANCYCGQGPHCGSVEALVDKLLRDHARELAEKILEASGKHGDDVICGYDPNHCQRCNALEALLAADLIDLTKESS
ncbi:hypothetical protein [Streptomyces sp. NPDC015131]|uniref:hypothetical protein n=1 Tax=Streptomyces sp. NPDC015131 TaxID=3364941 RepID=UPI0036F8CAC4